ncbi:hypothetical protein FB451DRAFT_299936 [Mycena latifolia]|nr:hypothetical protein FB451DRAFT_299936 [Mycena latifolia]
MELAATDTPFKDLLHTNAVLSDAECQRIHDLLAGPRKEVDKITDEIERLQTLINELTVKRTNLTEFIDAHLALVSPARRLPEDVVAEIFTAALPSDRNAVMSGAESPLLLCHVCRAWRRLALSTPRLSATLHIVAPGSPSELLQIDEHINAWLSSSGSLPLSISIVQSRTTGDLDISKLLGTLIRFSSRWNHLHLSLTSHSSFEPLATLAAEDVPMLRSLVLEAFSSWDSPTTVGSDSMSFMGTTLLRLSLRQLDFLYFPFRWDQLRHLAIGNKICRRFAPAFLKTPSIRARNSSLILTSTFPVAENQCSPCAQLYFIHNNIPSTNQSRRFSLTTYNIYYYLRAIMDN